MDRFAGATPEERRTLVVDAIKAHRERDSPYLTLEVDSEATDRETPMGPPPWIQYRAEDGRLNLDCTDAELAAVEAAIEDLGGVRITDRSSVPEAGTNLRVTASGDDGRVAMIVETLFREGFGLEEEQVVWAAEI